MTDSDSSYPSPVEKAEEVEEEEEGEEETGDESQQREQGGQDEDHENLAQESGEDAEGKEKEEEGDAKAEDQKRPRTKWGMVETADLVDGCYEHGVGAWAKILNDPKYHFHNRTPVDLKDRFRTIYPQEYKRLYPESQRVHQPKNPVDVQPPPFDRVQRRKRRPFTKNEDRQLWLGVKKHGVAWSKITKDPEFDLSHRQSTDLRDRFRNAFPDEYAALGYTERPRKKAKVYNRASMAERDMDADMESENAIPGTSSGRHTGRDRGNDQAAFWGGPPIHDDRDETPPNRRYDSRMNPLGNAFANVSFEDFPSGSRTARYTSAMESEPGTPEVNKIVAARIKGGEVEYKVRFKPSWAKGEELPPGSEPRVEEFVTTLNESASPLQEKTPRSGSRYSF